MKKKALCAALFLTFPCFAFGSFGLGAQSSVWCASSPYFGVSLLTSPLKQLHLALDYSSDASPPYNRRLGIYGDYWIFRPKIADWGVNYGRMFLFTGAGIFINITEKTSGGIRFPFGVQYEIKRMDFFINAAPSAVLAGEEKNGWFALYISAGLRYWF
ncbi:MAG: hypothetical protein LBC53_02810 [Spirochaetaceae bacterium]|nr:hypothetical protein [Spirochaetaceae bacterium]